MSQQFDTLEQSVAILIQQLGEREKPDEPKVLAHITDEEHAALCVGYGYLKWSYSEVLNTFLNTVLKLSVSRKGIGRKQLRDIGVAIMHGGEEEDSGVVRKILNKIGRKGD